MGLPEFYLHQDRTLWLEQAADGTMAGFVLDHNTGQFVAATPELMREVRTEPTAPTTLALDFQSFVLGTERIRELGPVADGTIEVLYQITCGIRKVAEDADRELTDEEAELIGGIHLRTFMRWEEIQKNRPKASWYQAPVQPPRRRRWFRRR